MNLNAIGLGSPAEPATGSLSGLLDTLLGLGRGSVFGGSTIGDLGSSISFS